MQIPHPEQKCTIPIMSSITKSQLDAINNKVLDKIGITEKEAKKAMGGSILGQALANAAQLICDALERDMRKKKVVASKNLIQSIDPTEFIETASGITLAIKMADYYEWVEDGRGKTKNKTAGTPTLSKTLETWISNKGIAVKKQNPEQTQAEALTSMAMAMARKIHSTGTIKRFGYKGAGFIRDVMTQETINNITASIAEITGRQVQVFVTTEVIQ